MSIAIDFLDLPVILTDPSGSGYILQNCVIAFFFKNTLYCL